MVKSKNNHLTLYKKAWDAFSLYVRTKENYTCFTCGKRGDKYDMQAGHFKHNVLDFDEMNVHCQCTQCNHFLSGRLDVYAEKLIQKYGITEFSALVQRAGGALRGERKTDLELEKIKRQYGKRTKSLLESA